MTSEPLRVEPMEVDYYQDRDPALAPVVWWMALVAIVSGTFHLLTGLIHLLGRTLGTGYWQYMSVWQTCAFMGGGLLAIVLLISGIGCLLHRPAARTGMRAYGYLMIALQTFVMGAYVMTTLRDGATPGLTEPTLDTAMMVMGYVAWMVQGCVFPVLAIVIFRMNAVERLFARG